MTNLIKDELLRKTVRMFACVVVMALLVDFLIMIVLDVALGFSIIVTTLCVGGVLLLIAVGLDRWVP